MQFTCPLSDTLPTRCETLSLGSLVLELHRNMLRFVIAFVGPMELQIWLFVISVHFSSSVMFQNDFWLPSHLPSFQRTLSVHSDFSVSLCIPTQS